MTGIVRDVLGALVVAVTAYVIGWLHGSVMSVDSFAEVVGPLELGPCADGQDCPECESTLRELRAMLWSSGQ